MITVYRGEEGTEHLVPLMDWANQNLFFMLENWDGELPTCWIAGGAPLDFLLGEAPKDIDIWFPSEVEFDQTVTKMASMGMKLRKSTSNSAIYVYHNSLGSVEYELVCSRYFPTPDETLEYFDFTVSSIAVGKDFVTYHDKAFEHIATHRLVINEMARPTNTLRRLPKYIAKGFYPTDEDLENLAEKISHLDMNDTDDNIWKKLREKGENSAYESLPNATFQRQTQQPMTVAPPLIVYPPSSGSTVAPPSGNNPGKSKKKNPFNFFSNMSQGSTGGGY